MNKLCTECTVQTSVTYVLHTLVNYFPEHDDLQQLNVPTRNDLDLKTHVSEYKESYLASLCRRSVRENKSLKEGSFEVRG